MHVYLDVLLGVYMYVSYMYLPYLLRDLTLKAELFNSRTLGCLLCPMEPLSLSDFLIQITLLSLNLCSAQMTATVCVNSLL